MSYLLDSNACNAIINDRPKTVRARLHEVVRRRQRVGLSSIALFELWSGVGKSARREAMPSASPCSSRRSRRCRSLMRTPASLA